MQVSCHAWQVSPHSDIASACTWRTLTPQPCSNRNRRDRSVTCVPHMAAGHGPGHHGAGHRRRGRQDARDRAGERPLRDRRELDGSRGEAAGAARWSRSAVDAHHGVDGELAHWDLWRHRPVRCGVHVMQRVLVARLRSSAHWLILDSCRSHFLTSCATLVKNYTQTYRSICAYPPVSDAWQ